MTKRDKNGRWQPGASGNPAGRPHDRAVALRRQLEANAPELVGKVIELALAGDPTALGVCMARLLPALKPHAAPVYVDIDGADSLAEKAEAVFSNAAAGHLPADTAAQLVGMLQAAARIVETSELAARLEALEKMQQSTPWRINEK